MSQLGLGTEWIRGGDGDAEGEEGKIEYGDVKGGRGEDECHVAFGERGEGLKGGGKGFDLAEEEGVGQVAVGGGVDDGGGDG